MTGILIKCFFYEVFNAFLMIFAWLRNCYLLSEMSIWVPARVTKHSSSIAFFCCYCTYTTSDRKKEMNAPYSLLPLLRATKEMYSHCSARHRLAVKTPSILWAFQLCKFRLSSQDTRCMQYEKWTKRWEQRSNVHLVRWQWRRLGLEKLFRYYCY